MDGLRAIQIDELYEIYAHDVFRFALYLSGNWQDAEDITAETFVRVWIARDTLRMSTVKAYLLTIARNLFLKELSKKRRHTELDEQIRDRSLGIQEHLEQRQQYEAVMRRMQQLPEIDRAALLMRAYGETPYEEIARSLGISLAAAKVKVHRARTVLAAAKEGMK